MVYTLSSLRDLIETPFDEIIDVRSPGEFLDDHLPGAVNMPVLDDDERALVGTIYKQESAFRARKIGGALVARRAGLNIERYLLDKPGSYRPLVYCWRGGMRSGAFATILKQIGWRAATLTRFQAGGFPIGLLVAARLSARLGGGLHFPPVPGAGVSLRVVLPCGTAETYREEEPSSGYAEEIPLAETFTGWQLGRPEPLLF